MIRIAKRCQPLVLTLVAVALTVPLAAETTEEAEELRYLELKPSFVTNFDFSEDGRLKYLKADINVRTASAEAEAAVKYHLPLMRNALVLLLSRQSEGTVSTREGRAEMREQAVEELNKLLLEEEGEAYVVDILFTNFIVQR